MACNEFSRGRNAPSCPLRARLFREKNEGAVAMDGSPWGAKIVVTNKNSYLQTRNLIGQLHVTVDYNIV